jgi:hypothetical protein
MVYEHKMQSPDCKNKIKLHSLQKVGKLGVKRQTYREMKRYASKGIKNAENFCTSDHLEQKNNRQTGM